METKTYVCVKDFGSVHDRSKLVENLNEKTIFNAYENENELIVVEMDTSEIGDFFAQVAKDKELNWIEYTLQIDA